VGWLVTLRLDREVGGQPWGDETIKIYLKAPE